MPIVTSGPVELPRKPKKAPVIDSAAPATNGSTTVVLGSKRKRSADDDDDTAEHDQQLRKRGKVDEQPITKAAPSASGVISLDDDGDGVVNGGRSVAGMGAITIDDD